MLALIERVRTYERRSIATSARSRERFENAFGGTQQDTLLYVKAAPGQAAVTLPPCGTSASL